MKLSNIGGQSPAFQRQLTVDVEVVGTVGASALANGGNESVEFKNVTLWNGPHELDVTVDPAGLVSQLDLEPPRRCAESPIPRLLA